MDVSTVITEVLLKHLVISEKEMELVRAELLQRLDDLCTDLTPKDVYPKVCAYCGRPAEYAYGG